MKLLFDFSLSAPTGTNAHELLRKAIDSAANAISSLDDGVVFWCVGESLAPVISEPGVITCFYEVHAISLSRKLLIDDLRNLSVDRIARTFDEGILALQQEGPWDILYLDHQLGDQDPKKTGYGIMLWLEANPQFLPRKIQLVTSDPLGRENMRRIVERLYSRPAEKFRK